MIDRFSQWHISFLSYLISAFYCLFCKNIIISLLACGGSFTSNNGLITSPNYPSVHPVSIECVYKITVAAGNKVQVYFRDFNIEAHSSCNYDFLEVRDGATKSSPLVGNRTWCGNVLPPSIVSSSNNLYLRFKSDATVSAAGFALAYTSSSRGLYMCIAF